MSSASPLDDDLRVFLGGAFSAEAVDRLDLVRDGLSRRSAERRQALRRSFRQLIDERRLDLRSWAQLTDVDFEKVEELYAYLDACHRYLFDGATDFPYAPY
jgi:cell division FtsZ-interacting protein ZapD